MEKKTPEHSYTIAISGAADTSLCGEGAMPLAIQLGQELTAHGVTAILGAVTGFPLWVAKGVHDSGGTTIGFSPAAGKRDHIEIHRLPTHFFNTIVYTGFGYAGSNLLMIRSAEAVIIGCGRVGTINELTIALQEKKPIGILQGPWKTDEFIEQLLNETQYAHRELVLFDDDPRRLVERILKKIREQEQGKESMI
jgi:uncharacterized protein (TIGR00725 family)